MKLLYGLYAAYAFFIFLLLFIPFFLLLLIPIIFPKWHHLTGVFNRWWSKIFFTFLLIPYRQLYDPAIVAGRQYIFCPNHFSYLDIPTMVLNKYNTIFMGKSDMTRFPLFGYMYKKLHIMVNRDSLKESYAAMLRAGEALDEGKNLTIFPEGGIMTSKAPELARFKDGAFRLAIEKQIPIIPVSIPYNWIILHDSGFFLRWHPLKVIYHAPIETKGMTLADMKDLKRQTFETIASAL